MPRDNKLRVIPSGLSISGWYVATEEDGTYSVHVDVIFETGKFGGAKEDLIEFELNLKRAEIVVVCGDNTTLLRSSIARSATSPAGQETQRTTTRTEGSIQGGIGTSATQPLALSVKGGAGASKEITREVVTPVRNFTVQHKYVDGDVPAWEVRSAQDRSLSGTPWDAVNEPRLKFRTSDEKDEPYVRVEVRCRAEDLDFGDGIRMKDETKDSWFKRKPNKDINLAAAEQYIKQVLMQEGLSADSISETFGDVMLADLILTVE